MRCNVRAVHPERPATDGLATLSADRTVTQAPEEVYAFLAELDNHWRLNDRYLRLEHLSADRLGGRIVIGTPIGLRRTARTRVSATNRPAGLSGAADVGRSTTARVDWNIEPQDDGARVELEATVIAAGRLDKLLLAAGGRWWLRRRFASVLALLADALDHPVAVGPRLSVASS